VVTRRQDELAGRRRIPLAGARGVDDQFLLHDLHRVALLHDLGAGPVQGAAGARVLVGDPSVVPSHTGTTGHTAEELVHVRLVVASPVLARDDRHGRALHGAALGHTAHVAELVHEALHTADQTVGDVGRRDRGRVRQLGLADDAALPHEDLDVAHGALVLGHVGRQVVEHAGARARQHGGLTEVETAFLGVVVVTQVDRDGALIRVDRGGDVDVHAVGEYAGNGVMLDRVVPGPGGELADLLSDAHRTVLLVRITKVADQVVAVLLAHLLETTFADTRRAHTGEVVAVPLIGHADTVLRHPDDVGDVLVVFLDLDTGPVESAFLVDVLRRRVVGARDAVATVRLMALGSREEHELAVTEDRSDIRVVGVMRVAAVWGVVEEQVPFVDTLRVRERRLHRKPHVGDMHRDARRQGDHVPVAVADRRRQVAADAHQQRPRRADHRVRHLDADAVEPAREHRHEVRLDGRSRCGIRVRCGMVNLYSRHGSGSPPRRRAPRRARARRDADRVTASRLSHFPPLERRSSRPPHARPRDCRHGRHQPCPYWMRHAQPLCR